MGSGSYPRVITTETLHPPITIRPFGRVPDDRQCRLLPRAVIDRLPFLLPIGVIFRVKYINTVLNIIVLANDIRKAKA